MTAEKLIPCPFCGRKAYLSKNVLGCLIECRTVECVSPFIATERIDPRGIIKKWNARAARQKERE